MNRHKELVRAIKQAKAIYATIRITADDMVHIKVVKSDALQYFKDRAALFDGTTANFELDADNYLWLG